MNLSLILQRTSPHGQPQTFGAITGELGAHLVFTLEDTVREITGKPVESWKVPGATAIPAGRYRVTLENSARFGAETLTLNDVPGFTSIRMHAGNTVVDTAGCPLLGMELDKHGIVVQARSSPPCHPDSISQASCTSRRSC